MTTSQDFATVPASHRKTTPLPAAVLQGQAMATLGEVFIKHPRYDVSAGLRVSYEPDPAKHGGNYVSTATLTIDTGACSIQVYATADTLRTMASLLSKAADAVDEGVFAAAVLAETAQEAA